VGRRLVEILTADGAEVTALNRGVTAVELPPGVARLVADRSDASVLARARGALEPLDASQHLLGNVVADIDGDSARCTCYFQAQHVRNGIPGGSTYIIAGSYTDALARTASGWKIAERVQVYVRRDGNRAVISR